MSYKISSDLPTAQQLEALQDKLMSLPAKGTHIGRGPHVPMPGAWDGTGSVPPGWTSYKGCSRQHPSKGEWATPLDNGAAAALAVDVKLTAPEKATVSAALAAKVDTLPADWDPEPKP